MEPESDKPLGGMALMIGMKDVEKESKQYLSPPAGFSPPPDVEPGDSFDITARVKLEEDGRLCVTQINGIPDTGKTEVVEEEEVEEESEEELGEEPSRETRLKDAITAAGY